ncbi:zinc finger BED domain-containing protein RICESLEEPER 3-like [Bidens hawaiensis]|uniref:zinc finger BED domain-containing protein RICESLEEPER 3-like n=1 Tax=Bidens hawaiensis TaxID=980011 RepID=UPI0040497011
MYPDRFKSCVVEKKLEPKRVFLDFPFRWDTTYDMLKMAPEFEEAFDLCETKDPDFKEVCENGVPSRINWVYARKLASLLEFFKCKTMEMSSTTYVVANQFFSEDMDVDTHLHELKDELGPRFKLMTNTMAEMFDVPVQGESCGSNWALLGPTSSNTLLYFAVILDPRMKVEVIKYGFTTICNMKKEPNTEQEVVDTMVEEMVKDVTDEFGLLFNEYELLYQTTNSNDDITELQKYLKDATMQNTEDFDILQRWKLNTSKYPTLSKMAKELLAIPLSTLPTESAFYIEKRVLDPYRSVLPVTIIEALVCTRDWVRKSRKDVIIEDFDDPDVF